WDKTVQAAKQEGQLRVWGGEEVSHPTIIAAFNKKHPYIKVITVTGRASQLVLRVSAERRAGRYLADVWATGPGGPRTLYLKNLLDPVADKLILPEVTDQSKWYNGKHHYGDPQKKYIFIYEGTPNSGMSVSFNTEKLKNPEQFKTLWDVVKKWNGKILLYTYGSGGSIPTPVLMTYYDPDVGPEFFKHLFEKKDLTVSRNRRQATNWLARGKFSLCLLCRDIERAQGQGLPVRRLDIERNLLGSGNSSVMALLKNAPNPNAAKVFINWYLSREGQIFYQNFLNTVVLEGSDSMRIDIPKDDVLPGFRRLKGKEYRVLGFPDPKPVQKFYRDILVRKQQMK
ncbi:MAG: extracellular solute-binding protein, partial [Deltaproteobacteria bacterium]|nr:extracellular solute-binding protein [Deltaproteobacteria bacterium]